MTDSWPGVTSKKLPKIQAQFEPLQSPYPQEAGLLVLARGCDPFGRLFNVANLRDEIDHRKADGYTREDQELLEVLWKPISDPQNRIAEAAAFGDEVNITRR